METQPRQHISNKYYTYTVVTSPVYIGSKILSNHLCSLFSGIIFDPSQLGACKRNVAIILRYFAESPGFFICIFFA